MKVGDRVWFAYAGNTPEHQGFGEILYIGIWRSTNELYYDVVKDGEDSTDIYYTPWCVEPYANDILVPERVYKSKLYKALK